MEQPPKAAISLQLITYSREHDVKSKIQSLSPRIHVHYLPDAQRGADDEAKVDNLVGQLTLSHPADDRNCFTDTQINHLYTVNKEREGGCVRKKDRRTRQGVDGSSGAMTWKTRGNRRRPRKEEPGSKSKCETMLNLTPKCT